MLTLLLSWLITAVILLFISKILPGIFINSLSTALIAALVIGLINGLVRPVLTLLTLPINILTLGLFAFVLNALLFWMAAAVVPGFEVTNFWSALFGSLLLALMTSLLGSMHVGGASRYR